MINSTDDSEKSKSNSQEGTPSSTVQHEAGAIDVGHWVSRATLDIIGLSGMGRDFNTLQEPDNELSKTYAKVFNASGGGILRLLSIFVPCAYLVVLVKSPFE